MTTKTTESVASATTPRPVLEMSTTSTCVEMNANNTATTTTRRRSTVATIAARRTLPVLTRFERAKLLAMRAEQIAAGGQVTFRNDTGEFVTPVEIATEELRRHVIPFYVVRTLPDGTVEQWHVRDFVNCRAT